MKLRLVRGLFECLGEGNYFNSEGKSASAEDVDDPPVFDFDILVFLIKLLEDSGELPGADPGLVLAVGAGAGDLPAAPDRGGGVGMAAIKFSLINNAAIKESLPQLHGHHPVFSPILYVGSVQGYFFQVEVTSDTEATHYVIDDNIHFWLRFFFDLIFLPNLLFELYRL